MISQFTAADFEKGAESYRQAGELALAKLALDRAEQLREQGDTSTSPSPFTITDLGEAAIQFSKEGKYNLAAQARVVIQKTILNRTLRNRR